VTTTKEERQLHGTEKNKLLVLLKDFTTAGTKPHGKWRGRVRRERAKNKNKGKIVLEREREGHINYIKSIKHDKL